MRYLITGAQGYLGKQLFNYMKSNYQNVYGTGKNEEKDIIQCNLLDIESVRNLINLVKPDLIVHCASIVPKKLIDYYDFKMQNYNCDILNNLLKVFRKKLIYISSMAVYGETTNLPAKEDDENSPSNAYGLNKLKCENILMSSNLDSLSIRIPGLYGLPRKNGLVYNYIRSCKYNKKPTLISEKLVWAGIYIEDVIESIQKAVELNLKGFETINIAYNERYSINRLIEIVNNIYGSDFNYELNHPVFEFNLDKAKRLNLLCNNNFKDSLLKFCEKI